MLYRLLVSMKQQCLYHEALQEKKTLMPETSMNEKDKAQIFKLEKDIKLAIKKFLEKEKRMFAGAIG